jgi:hypothetical protein
MSVSTVTLECKCGNVKGKAANVSEDTGIRLVCYCIDCQIFGHFVGLPKMLDGAGGTDLYQMPPAEVTITEGDEHIRCVRVKSQGMYRFYTACCRTPIGNMMGGKVPVIAIVHSFMDHAGDGSTRDGVMGRPKFYLWGKDAVGGRPRHAPADIPTGTKIAIGLKAAVWWFQGKAYPSPFFERDSVDPRMEVKVLTDDEREVLKKGPQSKKPSTSRRPPPVSA